VNRLSADPRFTLEFDYQGDFIPNPCKVTILDDSITIGEIAERIYGVSQHAVLLDGKYLVGSEADRDRHRKK
jgi:hypothetical protein